MTTIQGRWNGDHTGFPWDRSAAGLRIGYDDLVHAIKRMVAHLSPSDQDGFFWRNARAFYRL
jgi:predicted TIM-barrel fold metal-dependent hydrolase